MSEDRSARLGENVPRYTSYPTAPHFGTQVDGNVLASWLAALPPGEPASLYIHIPYCDRLCWFCACHTKQTHRYEPVADYLGYLHREIGLVSAAARHPAVGAVHFGGGSPTMLRPDDLRALDAALRTAFDFRPDASVSVEIDPNDITDERLDALAEIGLTRASLGIQDFDPKVQAAINRDQSFADTEAVVNGLRRRGVASVNLDLLYGLPHQTQTSLAETVRLALSMRPDRIALFGYAHVPWFKKHQTMIDENWLPGAEERLAQSMLAADLIREAGYAAIGIDHFALPGDTLAAAAREGRLHRNFQGYTDDAFETLIGLGPSSVGRYRQGYAQNVTATGDYQRRIAGGVLPVARGVVLSDDDHARAWAIERLMCDFSLDPAELQHRFGDIALPVAKIAASLAEQDQGMLVREGSIFVVPVSERALVRTVAARFDAYLGRGASRHSAAL